MPRVFGSPGYWRARAEEARNVARQMTDQAAAAAMLAVAENYEKIAARAEIAPAEGGAQTDA